MPSRRAESDALRRCSPPLSDQGRFSRRSLKQRRAQRIAPWITESASADPSFPFLSRRSSSFFVVFRAFRIRSASNSGSGPPQSFKAGPIRAETTQRQAPRQERDDLSTTLKSFQDRFGQNRSQQGSRGTLALINSLTVCLPVRCLQAPGLRCSSIWSLKAVSPYFALLFSFALCLCSYSDRPELRCLQYDPGDRRVGHLPRTSPSPHKTKNEALASTFGLQ